MRDNALPGDFAYMVQGLVPFRLEVFFEKWEFNARFHMTASDVESVSLKELLALADDADREAWERMQLGYTPVSGGEELRATIAETYEGLEADDIFCFAGAGEGIWCLMHALLQKSDHAVVATPNYQSLESIPIALCSVSGLPLREHADWSIDVDQLQSLINDRTKLIVTNFPNNPTGAIADRKTYDSMIAHAANRELYFFNDEVYRGIELDKRKQLPQIAEVYERGISLGVMSKAYGLPGLRVGWIACRDRSLLKRMARLKHYLSICNAQPSEVLAKIALKSKETLLARNRGIVSANLHLLEVFFKKHANLFSWYTPDGGCVAFPRYLGTDGVEACCKRLIEDYGVMLLPSSIYESAIAATPRDRFRVGFGRRGLDIALKVWETALA